MNEDENMMDDAGNIVYSKNVIEFVTVANEYCAFIERIVQVSGKDILVDFHKLLPFLYLKATLLPKIESCFDETNEKFVTEAAWQQYYDTLRTKLGKHDEYFEVFDPMIHDLDGPATGSIAENLADIYQDIKDFLLLYRIGDEAIMNDAIWECKMNFEQFWGQKLTNALRAIHHSVYNANDDDDDTRNNAGEETPDINNWIISQRQQQLKKGGKNVFGEDPEGDTE